MIFAKAIAWTFLALDIATLLFQCVVAARTGPGEGQQGWAILFTILGALVVALGGGVFALGIRRKSTLVVGIAAAILGFYLLLGLTIWIDALR